MSAPKEILNNEEIDALLQMFRSESEEIAKQASAIAGEPAPAAPPAPTPPPPPPGVVTPIDLLKPTRVGREQIRGLERYFQSAGKMLSATIGEKLRLDTRCECVAVEQMRSPVRGSRASFSLAMISRASASRSAGSTLPTSETDSVPPTRVRAPFVLMKIVPRPSA
jgi:hypothetical protein